MTQDEFDALDDTRPGEPAAMPVKPDLLSALKAQGPIRLSALALMLVTAGTVGAMTFLGDDPVETSAVEPMPALTEASRGLPQAPQFPDVPDAVADLAPIRAVDAVEQTQTTSGEATTTQVAAPVRAAEMSEAEIPVATAATDCTVTVDAMALAGALIGLDVRAPCDAGARVDFFLGDLRVAETLDEMGQGQITLPALSRTSTVATVVEGRAPVSLLAEVSDIASYNRTVLHWQGDMGLELHAFEGASADYGADGHVSPLVPRTIAHALSGNGGYMTMLGDPALEGAHLALVYTAGLDVSVAVGVDVPVLARNCGQEIFADMIKVASGNPLASQELTLTMPDCDATGGIVMLGELITFAAQVDVATN